MKRFFKNNWQDLIGTLVMILICIHFTNAGINFLFRPQPQIGSALYLIVVSLGIIGYNMFMIKKMIDTHCSKK